MNSSISNSPLVSVVMAVWNPHPIYFVESIESVRRQTLLPIEIIVVEDPSTHTAEGIIDGLHDARIRYYRNPDRTSLVQQRNRGLAEARADFVAMQDADDIAETDRLEKQLEFLRAHPTVVVLGTQMRVIDSHGGHIGYRCYPQDHSAIVSAMRLFNPIAQPTVMFRKHEVLAAGGYQYTAHAVEDYELWSRLALRQEQFSNHPEALLRYRVHVEANKMRKLHDTLQGTLAVKKMYWLETMDLSGRARMLMESLLLRLPAWIVWNLFVQSQLSSRLRA